MKKKYPILIIIPHGGYRIPDELAPYMNLDEFDIFMEADTCANELFSFDEYVSAKIDTLFTRLLVDTDRHPLAVPPASKNGVIKRKSFYNKNIFQENFFPDEIAISNIIKRCYIPFHQTIEKILKTGEIKLIVECHTMMAVGPSLSADRGNPRPIINIENITKSNGKDMETCSQKLALDLLQSLEDNFEGEDETITAKFKLNDPQNEGYIMKKFGKAGIPMLRLSVSKSLFLNDTYFSYDYLKVDELRIKNLRKKIWSAVENFYTANFS